MPSDLFDQEDPRDWSDERRREEFRSFREEEVVGEHCESCQYDPDPVIKRGTLDADLLVVGDYTAPADQRTNKPFSGPAGELLEEMLAAIDRDWKSDCYVTNALLCDGTASAPRKASVEACRRNLTRQLDIVDPELLLCAGKFAYQSIFREPSSVTLRDNLGHYESVPGYPGLEAVVTVNPAYVLRQEGERRKNLKKRVWDHLKTVREVLEE